jgi:hypothetical protein
LAESRKKSQSILTSRQTPKSYSLHQFVID